MTADTMSVPTARLTTPDTHRSGTRPTRVIRASRPSRAAHPSRAALPFHADRETAPAWMRVVGTALLLGGGGLSAAVLGWPGDAPEVALLVPALLAVALGSLLLLARAGFTVTERHVTLHFRPLPPRRIPRRRITDVRLVEADAATYGGVGLRIRRGERALILTPGLGIELTDDRGRVTFVRTRRPEDAFRALAGLPGGADRVERERLG
ncbi:hypothetical protein [Curtobacterium flaccumfaciens]|uniref:hypothetical protein n=1 Tax=Curtobacterium flaccumfaciens TaxID=2035 RepID=UPI000FFEE6AC|nr:hypothetical protein [Curtobacterium flaccumfaciens]MCS0647246.1 hypothetical protein [Curtobacterium flaccumfaciens pv. flaccumfaciens]MCS6524841.1 hypothetical protein [Curtobacterium flaccumfaciens pv. flaccumfaciens]MCS6529987.1 hypothetical protein [Curtobacterium flaccumfaciens pv. flaccumfaciens]NUU09932.1 hypothetical protein [Curtobacterium flaccumfaciens]RXF84889.1 hypothetical protein CffCFBP3418_07375 [Curtobacterium flaccumfaciens pv. flaccumfaciens]